MVITQQIGVPMSPNQLSIFGLNDQYRFRRRHSREKVGCAIPTRRDCFTHPTFLAGTRAYFAPAFSIFAQVSRRATVRLKTGRAGVESGSTQK